LYNGYKRICAIQGEKGNCQRDFTSEKNKAKNWNYKGSVRPSAHISWAGKRDIPICFTEEDRIHSQEEKEVTVVQFCWETKLTCTPTICFLY
jgi:hypothetical protein